MSRKPKHYISYTDIAKFLGVTKGSLGNTKLPDPDVYISNTRGWDKVKIEEWAKTRRTRRH